MRALILSTRYPDGQRTDRHLRVHERVRALGALGAEMQVVAPTPHAARELRDESKRVPAREWLDGIGVTHPPLARGRGLPGAMRAWRMVRAILPDVRRLHAACDPDLLDAYGIYPEGVAAARIAGMLGLPCMLTSAGDDLELPTRSAAVRKQVLSAMARARAVVAPSASCAEKLFRLGCDRHRLHVVPEGIDGQRFRYGEPAAARERLGIAADDKLLVCAGALAEGRGHELVIDAVARLEREGVRTSLHVFGDGPLRGRLEARIAPLGLGGRLILHGKVPRERLAAFYQAASLLVSANDGTVWSPEPQEALACGLPVVTTEVDATVESMAPGENGLVSGEPTSEALAAAIRQALAHPWQRAAIAARASRPGWDDVARHLLRLYRMAAGRTGRPSPALQPQPA